MAQITSDIPHDDLKEVDEEKNVYEEPLNQQKLMVGPTQKL